jgi:hypothetical protein
MLNFFLCQYIPANTREMKAVSIINPVIAPVVGRGAVSGMVAVAGRINSHAV